MRNYQLKVIIIISVSLNFIKVKWKEVSNNACSTSAPKSSFCTTSVRLNTSLLHKIQQNSFGNKIKLGILSTIIETGEKKKERKETCHLGWLLKSVAMICKKVDK